MSDPAPLRRDRFEAPQSPMTRLKLAFPALCLIFAALLVASGALERVTTSGTLGNIETRAITYLDSSQRMAIEAFAAGRAINAAAAVLKSTELTPLIVKIAPLELLEPIDDLAKQFSDVMAISLVAILLQRLLLAVSKAWALDIALPIGCALWLLAIFAYRWPSLGRRLSALGRGIVVLAVFTRCVIPLAGWAGDGLTNRFLAVDLHNAVATMNAAGGNLDRFTALATKSEGQALPDTPSPAPATPDPTSGASSSWWDLFGPARKRAGAVMDTFKSWIPDRAAITKALEDVPEQIVTAIEIFLVQTILVPLVVGVLLYSALRIVARPTR